MSTFELETFITSTLASHQAYAHQKGIELHTADDLASHVNIIGDTRKIRHLLDSVLQATIDNSGSRRILFSIRQLLRSDKEILLEFLLETDGSSSCPTCKQHYELSLAKAKSLIEELDGKSELMTAAENTTNLKFIIKFPFTEHPPATHNLVSSCTSALQDKKILVVEDNEINQRTITSILKQEGIAYGVAANGKECLDMLEVSGCRYDVVLLDTDMPHMDGFQTANYIRKKICPKLPIIGMILGIQPDETFQCLEAGMNQFIRKPFAAEELLTQLCSFFDPSTCVMDEPELKPA